MKTKQQILLRKITIIAMFSALCCAATFVQIKMPAGDMVHLGNFVMLLAALLFGGLTGGITGSLGMGLYDILFYSSKPTTVVRTFILKFIIGFIVGYLFRTIIRKKKDPKFKLLILSIIFFGLFTISLVAVITGTSTSDFSSIVYINLFSISKKITISYFIPIFTFIFGLSLLLAFLFSMKLDLLQKAVLYSVTIAICVNILGEFILRYLLEGLFLSDFKTSLIVATSKIPGSLITGFFSVILTVFVYEPIYIALKKSGNDLLDLSSFDEEEEDEEEKNHSEE